MDEHNKAATMDTHPVISSDFVRYLQSTVKLEELEQMTKALDDELLDSQCAMNDIKGMFDSISTLKTTQSAAHGNFETVTKFLEADCPNLLMPGMSSDAFDGDVDAIIATMKSYAEKLKNKLPTIEQKTPKMQDSKLEPLEFKEYAHSLEQLGKRLTHIKSIKSQESNRNMDLEDKLTLLCQDVNLFTQMFKSNTTLNQCNETWKTSEDNKALQYEHLISKLLSGINEVTYLLQNKA